MWYINYHSAPDIKKVIETTEKAKKNGIKSIIQELQEHNNCIYVFADGFEYNGKKLDTDTVKAYKETHGKLNICIIK